MESKKQKQKLPDVEKRRCTERPLVIIDEAGLRGLTCGGTKVADFHGNFIINTGNAKAAEIKELVQLVQEKVKNKFGFFLEPEIIFVEN